MLTDSIAPTEPVHDDAPPATLSGSGALAVHGPLAAAMERLVALAASALRAPFAFVLLTGEDRRCFAAGEDLPRWASHDAGALWRSGIVERIIAGPLEISDLRHDLPAEQSTLAAELEIGSLLGAPIRTSSGQVLGVFCAADLQPTQWNADDHEMLQRFASMAASDWELRRTLAEHEANERRLGFYSNHDPLTGLANRAVLLDRLRFALARPRIVRDTESSAEWDDTIDVPNEELVAVFFLDVNDFRKVNERFGHHVGDQLLSSIGKRLRQTAGQHATVARLGGDEFAVLIERVDGADMAEELANRFRLALSQPTTIGGEDMTLTVSVGIALSTTTAELPEHILRGADLAMATAKRSSRREEVMRPTTFDWKIAAESRARRRMQDELRQAVLGNEFLLHYLPIVALETGIITGAEALLRWAHPTRGLLMPYDFLGTAEELDIMNDVGRWVLREGCNQLREWHASAEGPVRLTLAVNLSAREFNATDFLPRVDRTMRLFGLDPSLLTLEVNERVIAADVPRAIGVLTGLRSLGTRILLDDFGSGNSPIGYLQQLPLDGVKIDHTLVNRMERDDRALRLVRSVVGLAREFGLDVVAEGITQAAHLRVLQDIGCTHGQGPLFSPAVEASGVTALLSERPW